MKNFHAIPLTLIALAILAGCNTTTHNAQLKDAHERYKFAQGNPQIITLASAELNEAGSSLSKADNALSKGESAATINQLSYIAIQQISIAQETANRKNYELAVTNASANRNQIRLDARTAEADAAKRQVVIANETVNQQAEDLAAADANAQTDQAVIVIQEMQIRDLNAKQTKRGLVVTLGDVLFNSGKSELKSSGTRNVQKVADFLMQNPQRDVMIEGFTDSVGSESSNQVLSERRADSVRSALIDLGVSADRISTKGYGEEHPVSKNDTSAHRQSNRRVEIIFSEDDGAIPTM
jgi:outer membrane protein OmpA-like peptidoglycan-associated protein